ncbi:BREX-1 system adenine-specific DNA-methyltransferase PglX [Halothiobacillus sp.]|uniref:BREX-1 system adenine-specific DNA-methyltransferase PglX n=1 Tax=Halothiobacillus sp. TaxID=1891311 RepID=UPI00261EAB38|nr:BREX-1 system adenine-specific DNA-methyltransferase PglX [Halothiobacillus sp.]MDD4966082.1 BREX-1 system adenine-specific DNA-methyltransferase PglX [Halothiobacillus sp.]
METAKLKKFAQFARRSLLEQVSAKLKLVLAENGAARRERAEAIKKLEEAIKGHGKEQVIERVAYIWFNRFCALRFMDVNRYTRIGVVSPSEGQFQPEILAEAKMGHIDDEMVHDKIRQQIFALLDGKAPSRDPQGEAYRLLVVAACNFWNKAMPFLFQRIDDYTELLMPDDLLSGNSILAYTREAMTPDACEDVEVIGWLYQFYISEKKDEVFDGLKKNKKITPENIPAATQLFTPHWIVRYLVENSLGRLWLLNRPGSKLVEQMDYYIKPEQAETDFLRIGKPEEIKICDPACGSGHMLTYAFDLLYTIYEEEGYEPAEIPEKILTHNLYGIEIDERAGELAAFALTMKARAKQRRFFNKGVKPNICVLENVHFDGNELKDYMDFVGRDLFTAPLQTTLRQFEEADNFGSLIRPDVTDVDGMLRILKSKNVSGQLFISMTHQKVLQALRQADYLSPKYHVVIANPPYMGNRSMAGRLQAFAKDSYPNSKSDLFAMFIERNLDLANKRGSVAMITMQSWMFLSSFETLRTAMLQKSTIVSMAHLGARAFDSIGGEVVSTTAFVITNSKDTKFKGSFLRLTDGRSEAEKDTNLKERRSNPFLASTEDFKKIPGSPIAYWVSDTVRNTFTHAPQFGEIAKPRQGLATGCNDIFLRAWHEVSLKEIGFGLASRDEAVETGLKWFPYNKGGDWRKWYGNCEYVVDWEDDGIRIRNFKDENGKVRSRPQNTEYYFREGITWADITTNSFAARHAPNGFIFDVKGSSGFPARSMLKQVIGLMNSKLMLGFMQILNPTTTFQVGDMARVPFQPPEDSKQNLDINVKRLISLGKHDWDSYETSWDFRLLELLQPEYRQPTLKATYQNLRAHWREITLEMQQLEKENNRIFIEAYGLQDELTPEVPLTEITLTCNPHYRYGGDKSEEELEALLLADTMRELVSYAVGCMFGRYALDKPGLLLANQGETIEDYLKRVPEPSFPADDDNVIPMLDGDWFTDDIAERFRKFLRVAFGDEHYEANLKFVEKALGKNGKARDIRDYFLKDFYSDHVRRYKKRPIYWLFSSPKGSFNALIYMHRYRPDTVSVVLNDYLREFRTKLTSHKNHLEAVSISASSSQGEKTKALKEIEKITKMIAEMEEYEREVLYPLATEQVEIDLDDGVKLNYPKLGAALKKIVGLDAKGEE